MEYVVIIMLILERIAFAIIAFLAAIHNQVWLSIIMCILIVILFTSTEIHVPGRKE